jgi:hypothetical protein
MDPVAEGRAQALGLMRADRYDWYQIGRWFACDRNKAARRWKKALELVADRLNAQLQTISTADTIRHA